MDPLPDPVGDRQMKDIIPLPTCLFLRSFSILPDVHYFFKLLLHILLNLTSLFLESTIPNWEVLKNHMYKEGRVSKEHCQRILRDTLALISNNQRLIY